MTAAVALLSGWSDPLDLLALSPHDYALAVAVIAEADRLRDKRDQALADYVAAKTAGLTAQHIARMLRQT